MKILMIDSLVGNDYSFWLCRGLAEAGNEVTLITTRDHALDKEAWPFHILTASPSKSKDKNKVVKLLAYIYYLIWLYLYVWRTGHDVVHFQFFRRERLECLYFPLLKPVSKELVFTAHNILPHEHGKIDHYLRHLVYKSADKIIVHTETIRQKLLNKFQVKAGKVFVVPAVKPMAGNYDAAITKSVAREKLNLPQNAEVLLFFGYIRDYKGIDLLLDAFEKSKAEHPNLQLVIAGNPKPPSLRETYADQIDHMQYGDSVTLRAEFIPQDEVDYYFSAADALALPYRNIDFSGIMQEAFAYHLPVLATDVGNFADFIDQGVNGYIADEISPASFAAIINCAFDDMDRLAQMGEAAFRKDQEYPDWSEIGRLSMNVYGNNYHGIQ